MSDKKRRENTVFNVVCVAQNGRLAYESLIFAASFRAQNPDFPGRLLIAEPQPGPRWPSDTRLPADVRATLDYLKAEIIPFDNHAFGHDYPYGNKIEALLTLPNDVPFFFFDTDRLFTGPLSALKIDFDRPSASMRREGTWPQPPLYGPE
ncbi:MAG: hypothetical protein ORN49_10515, partial [Rhodobacteraceae bacterium]|nr:hypothetical protein [Paracoccaceae bacterium]